MANPHSRFGDLIPGWPEDGPQSVPELMAIGESDPGSLSESQRALFSWLLEATRVGGQVVLASPKEVRKLLTFRDKSAKSNGSLVVPRNKWLAVPVDETRKRILDANRKGPGHHWRQFLADSVPDPDTLMVLPARWGWLLLHGGGPEALSNPEVIDALVKLGNSHQLLDVLFWDAANRTAPALWSAKAGVGSLVKNGKWESEPIPLGLTAAFKEVPLT
jgi:hypothetical protein